MNNIRRGWCPSLYKPMKTGDGYLCRIKPFFCSISSHQARFIAELSQTYGNGYINLSQKGNLQMRGFTRENVDIAIPLVIQEKLGSKDANMEERRNIMISPLWDIDTSPHSEIMNIAQELLETLQCNPDIHPLTGKFSFLIDGQEQYGLEELHNDINIRADHQNWVIQLGNSEQVILCAQQDIAKIVLDIMQFCIDHGYKRLLNPESAQKYFSQTHYPTEIYTPPHKPDHLPIGFVNLPNTSIIHVGAPFGLMKSQHLAKLAEIAEQFGDGTIRFTPWRSLILPHCSAKALTELKDDFITQDNDPRLHIVLCPGKPSCSQGQQNTMEDVNTFLLVWRNQSRILHLSGCAKGCASPQVNPVTLSATEDGYNLIFDGKADQDTPYQNLKLTDIVSLLQNESSLQHTEKP